MLWHDSRFMQHTRFRYWLLDTMLRVKGQHCRASMIPGSIGERRLMRQHLEAMVHEVEG